MLDRLPHLLWYAALIGLGVILFEHLLDSIKGNAKKQIGLR